MSQTLEAHLIFIARRPMPWTLTSRQWRDVTRMSGRGEDEVRCCEFQGISGASSNHVLYLSSRPEQTREIRSKKRAFEIGWPSAMHTPLTGCARGIIAYRSAIAYRPKAGSDAPLSLICRDIYAAARSLFLLLGSQCSRRLRFYTERVGRIATRPLKFQRLLRNGILSRIAGMNARLVALHAHRHKR
jgi:hypothetical protein